MPACPKCGADVSLSRVAPRQSEVAARGLAFSQPRTTVCGKCGAKLEVVGWTFALGLVLSLAVYAAPTLVFPRLSLWWPELNALMPAKPGPLWSLLKTVLLIAWLYTSLFLVMRRTIRLRVAYDPQNPLSIS
jgi:hypothetical protein